MRLLIASTFLFLSSITIASEYPFQKSVLSIQKQLPVEKAKIETKIYMSNVGKLKTIESTLSNIYQDRKNAKKLMFDLTELRKRTQSLYVAAIIIDEFPKYFPLSNLEMVNEYLAPVAEILYINKICKGYIYKGEIEKSINKNLAKEIEVYKEGLTVCSKEIAPWEHFAILSRLNSATYNKMRKIK